MPPDVARAIRAAKILNVVRILLATFGLAAVGVAAILTFTLHRSWATVFTVGVLAVSGLLVWSAAQVLNAVRERIDLRLPEELEEPQGANFDISDVIAAHNAMSLSEAELFRGLILEPARYFLRIAETATPIESHTTLISNYSVDLALVVGSKVMVPLIMKERGVLADGLKISDGNGHRISSVPYGRQTAYIGAVCRHLVESAGGKAALGRYIATAEAVVLRVLNSQSPTNAVEYFEVVEELRVAFGKKDDRAEIGLIGLFLRQLHTRVPILIEASRLAPRSAKDPAPLNLFARYSTEQDIGLSGRDWDSRPNARRFRRLFRNAKLLLSVLAGVSANEILVPLDNADRCQSYHLLCNGLTGVTYLGHQYLDKPADKSTVKIKARRGQSYSHLYLQNGRSYTGRYFESSFFEVPPGATGLAAAAAAGVLLGVFVVAWHQLHWSEETQVGLPSLLIALPGAIGAFLGFGRAGGFLRGSIRARASSVVSLGVAITGLVSAAVIVRDSPWSSSLMIDDVRTMEPLLVFWVVVIGLQALNLLFTTSLWIYRSFVYWAARTSYH